MGKIVKVSGPLVVATGLEEANMADVVRVGEQRLIGEILTMNSGSASIQVYEETSGLGPGAEVVTTGAPMSVELGPGMIEGIYDGIQRPLEKIVEKVGANITRGVEVPALDREKQWDFVATAQVGDHKVVLLKPLTYMNLSGQSIAPAANFYKIPADHIIVLCDDITQEPGHLRIRPHGSAGGHNGLKSIIASLDTENFNRIRIGIGAKPNPQYDLAAWVLGKLPPADRKAMTDRYPDIEDACKLLMDGNLQYAQNKFNH